jgi:hypothetical protein
VRPAGATPARQRGPRASESSPNTPRHGTMRGRYQQRIGVSSGMPGMPGPEHAWRLAGQTKSSAFPLRDRRIGDGEVGTEGLRRELSRAASSRALRLRSGPRAGRGALPCGAADHARGGSAPRLAGGSGGVRRPGGEAPGASSCRTAAGRLSAVLACAPRASRSPQAGSIPAMTVIVPPFRGPRSGSCHPGYQPLPRHGRSPARNLGLGLS